MPRTERQKQRRRERYAEDRERINAHRRAHYHAHKHEAAYQARNLKYLYGMTQAEYDALLAKQGGMCAICGRPPKPNTRLYVDHCHLTGRVRGLLCRGCNFALGQLGENQRTLIAALAYLACSATDGPGAAAQRALLARAVLPPGPRPRVEPTAAHSPDSSDAGPLARAAGLGRSTPAARPIPGSGAVPSTNSIQLQPNRGDMTIDDDPPEGGAAARPMWEALAAELRRESEDGDGRRAELLQLIARRLAAKALEGDLGAIKEIFDRMDGKSTAGAAPVEQPGKVTFQWKDPQ